MNLQIAKQLSEKIQAVKHVFVKEKKPDNKKLITVLTIFFVAVIILLFVSAPIFAYEYIYQHKIYAGVYIDGVNISGLNQETAISKLNQHIDNLKASGLTFIYQNQPVNVDFLQSSPEDPDLATPILSFDTEAMVKSAFTYGRDSNLLTNLLNQLKAILEQKEIALNYHLQEDDLIKNLQQAFSGAEKPAQNARLKFLNDDQYEILAESHGQVLDYEKALQDLQQDLNLISINAINLRSKPSTPDVTKIEALESRSLVDNILKNEQLTLIYGELTWSIPKAEFKNWLVFAKKNNQIVLQFNEESLKAKLQVVAKVINVLPQDAKLAISDGKVTEFLPHKMGLELDLESNVPALNKSFFVDNQIEYKLVVKESAPKVKTGDINDYGIEEIIGVGKSDFVGSHTNRIKNITNAANKLHGMLVKPGEEFSLAERLGDITAATGYFPEYVIKGDRTIPEYGGGLCQIATTTFRAALYTGLPITERKPHSYMVAYYKPIGMDAAIYTPHPDVRFINDTGNYILIQTDIVGTKLTFTFWGKSDGRQVEITEPEVYNWRGPGEPKYIENPALKPGEKKLVEAARSGADAHFYRYITRLGQEKQEEIFRSHYSAWRAIYEIGVEVKPVDTQPSLDPNPALPENPIPLPTE